MIKKKVNYWYELIRINWIILKRLLKSDKFVQIINTLKTIYEKPLVYSAADRNFYASFNQSFILLAKNREETEKKNRNKK